MDYFQLGAGALAYLGDAVLEALIREALILKGFEKSAHLNKEALAYVKATAQAEAMKNIVEMLDEDEEAAFRRGRNVGHTATPKSASMSEYRAATGMEALFGWLHLLGREERIRELFRAAYKIEEKN